MWALASNIDPWAVWNVADDVVGTKNAWLAAPLMAYDTAQAPRGDQVATFGSGAIGLGAMLGTAAVVPKLTSRFGPSFLLPNAIKAATSPTASWLMRNGVGRALPWLFNTSVTVLVAGEVASIVRSSAHRLLRQLKEDERSARRLEMGGGYEDYGVAQAWRHNAIAEMSGSLQTARSYLGREGLFAHR